MNENPDRINFPNNPKDYSYPPVKIGEQEFIQFELRNGQPFIRWIKDNQLVVDRPAYGAEDKLLKTLLHIS